MCECVCFVLICSWVVFLVYDVMLSGLIVYSSWFFCVRACALRNDCVYVRVCVSLVIYCVMLYVCVCCICACICVDYVCVVACDVLCDVMIVLCVIVFFLVRWCLVCVL